MSFRKVFPRRRNRHNDGWDDDYGYGRGGRGRRRFRRFGRGRNFRRGFRY